MIEPGTNIVVTILYLGLAAVLTAIAYHTVPLVPGWIRDVRIKIIKKKLQAVEKELHDTCPHFEITSKGVDSHLAEVTDKIKTVWVCQICRYEFPGRSMPDVVQAPYKDLRSSLDVVGAWVKARTRTTELIPRRNQLTELLASITVKET